jgi:hypothetical protein
MRQAHHLVILGADLGIIVPQVHCMGNLDSASYLPADRFPQPAGSDNQLGMVLFLLR